jgi:hypothetical protein
MPNAKDKSVEKTSAVVIALDLFAKRVQKLREALQAVKG